MLITTEVGVEVSEIIEQVLVDFKDNVRKGQILVFTLLDKKSSIDLQLAYYN